MLSQVLKYVLASSNYKLESLLEKAKILKLIWKIEKHLGF